MLKAKECYPSEDLYTYQLFLHKADIHCYALDPALETQVKVLVRPKGTEPGLNKRSRLVFLTKEGRSKFFYHEDISSMLDTIEIVRNKNVKNYTDILVYRSSERTAFLGININQEICQLINNQFDIGPKDLTDEQRADNAKIRFSAMLDRLESILKQALEYCQNELDVENKVPYHFTYGKISTLPLNNRHNGYAHPITLRKIQGNHISITVRNRSLILYGLKGENTATLPEVVEGFIRTLQNLCGSFNIDGLFDGTDCFVKSERVSLGIDREHFMEYVSVRSLHHIQNNGEYTTVLINMNSDVTPSASKTTFHYHPEFMEDLYNGLRFLVNL